MQLDLSTLSGPELRQLLDSARQRGQAAQSYQILQEMDRRRVGGGPRRRIRARRSDEPHLISLDLGDPLSRPDPALDLPPAPTLEDAALSLPREPRPRRKALRPPWPLAGFAAGLAVGAALGVHAAGRGSPPLQAPARPLATAQVADAPLAPVAAPPAPVAAPAEPLEEPAGGEVLDVVVASPDAHDALDDVVKVEPPRIEVAEKSSVSAAVDDCVSQPTPADRAMCADPDLKQLQRELRDAYSAALAAHEERGLLRERQLAWREARSDVAEPAHLARLYEDRIRKLNAAAADARRRR
jgi:uncharacterized protein YecT (DUF1311 family)